LRSKNLYWVGFYAVAMAYLESAVVVYLRRLYGIGNLMVSAPAFDAQIGAIELGRELATLVMLLSVGWIAGKKFQSRAGFMVFAFGLWDIFYYVWLKVFIGWPQTLFDQDLLFLIPLPWWGPVLAPVLIAALMCLAGALAVIGEERGAAIRLDAGTWGALILGAGVMLYAFMADALAILPADARTLSQMHPTGFAWPVFLGGLALAAFACWRMLFSREKRAAV
jgi:hypothetical protein